MSQGYINYNTPNGYEKFYPYSYKSEDSLKLGGVDSSQYVLFSSLSNIITKSQIYSFSLEIPMASSVSWGSDPHYAKNNLGLTTFDLNYDTLFCSYSITITPTKSSRAPDGAYIILQCGFLGSTNYSTGQLKGSSTLKRDFYYLCLRDSKASYTAITQGLEFRGESLPSIKMTSANYSYQASAKITGEYYYIKF